jgi:NAD+ kinase
VGHSRLKISPVLNIYLTENILGGYFMTFFIEKYKGNEKALVLEQELILFLKENKQEVSSNIKDCDFILSLGGDGTFIRAVNKYRKYNKAILGINCGHLGYLTELNISNYKEKLLKLINNEYTINKRVGLTGTINNMQKDACNDIVIRNNNMNIIDFDVYVNDTFLSSFKADGIIISTPIGSTGYALSCGGSFVDPNSDNILLNLIAPHTLMNRSIVLNSNVEIKIVMKEVRGETAVAVDGDILSVLKNEDIVYVKKSKNPTRIVEIEKTSFINLISQKLS